MDRFAVNAPRIYMQWRGKEAVMILMELLLRLDERLSY